MPPRNYLRSGLDFRILMQHCVSCDYVKGCELKLRQIALIFKLKSKHIAGGERRMDAQTVFTKTAKGVTQVNQKAQSLSKDMMKVLKLVDGKSTITEMAKKVEVSELALSKALGQLKSDGYIKVFEIKADLPSEFATDFGGAPIEVDDFDFTGVGKMPVFQPAPVATPAPAVAPPQSSSPILADLGSKPPPAPVVPPPPAKVDENALATARAKAQADQALARAKVEREAGLRTRLEVEARARKELEIRAIAEAKRAQAASEAARAELEASLETERKQRAALEESRATLSRQQVLQAEEAAKALEAARARAQAEAQALAGARALAEAEARMLAEARVQAEELMAHQAAEAMKAQKDLRAQLKAEIELQVRAEIEEKMRVEVEDQARGEVNDAIIAEAREQAAEMLELRLVEERASLARAESSAKERAEIAAQMMLAEQETRIRAEMQATITAISAEKERMEIASKAAAIAQTHAAEQHAMQMAEFVRSEAKAAELAAENARIAAAQAKTAADNARTEREARMAVEAQAEMMANEAARAQSELAEKLKVEENARRQAEQKARQQAQLEREARAIAVEQAAQAAAASAQSSELAQRLKTEEAARLASEEEARARAVSDQRARERLEARVREEAQSRAAAEAQMNVRLAQEQEQNAQAKARILTEQSLRAKAELGSEAERLGRLDAEEKVRQEARARAIASQAVIDQVAEKERIVQEAETLLQAERTAREFAEERANADERAEAKYRQAQVEHLRELNRKSAMQKQIELETGIVTPKRRAVKKDRHLVRWTIFSIVALGGIAVAALPYIPLDAVNKRLSTALSAHFQDDVIIATSRVSVFPNPHLIIERVSMGKTQDVNVEIGRAYMDLGAIFGNRFVIQRMELDGVTFTENALARAGKWSAKSESKKEIEIGSITLRDVKFSIAGLKLEPFDAEVTYDAAGALTKVAAKTKDLKWSLSASKNKAILQANADALAAASAAANPVANPTATPAASMATPEAPTANAAAPAVVAAPAMPAIANATWALQFGASNYELPAGAPLVLRSVQASGVLGDRELLFNNIVIDMYDGRVTGALRANWQDKVQYSGSFAAARVKLTEFMQVFSKGVTVNGRMEGNFNIAGEAPTVGTLLAKPQVDGSFYIRDGLVSNIDLVQVMRTSGTGSTGGQNKFTEFSGLVKAADGVVRYEKLRMLGGVLIANGSITVTPTATGRSSLSGGVAVEIRSAVAQDRGSFALSGSVANPVLKR